jgi:hypothetical protein
MTLAEDYPTATEFLMFWYAARPLELRQPEQVAVRAALDLQPQIVQRVRRELKLLLAEPRFDAAWLRRTANWVQGDEEQARRWVVRVIGGLTKGSRIRNQTGRVERHEPFGLTSVVSERGHRPAGR